MRLLDGCALRGAPSHGAGRLPECHPVRGHHGHRHCAYIFLTADLEAILRLLDLVLFLFDVSTFQTRVGSLGFAACTLGM